MAFYQDVKILLRGHRAILSYLSLKFLQIYFIPHSKVISLTKL